MGYPARRSLLLIVCTSLAGCAGSIHSVATNAGPAVTPHPELQVSEEIVTFRITGSTADELRAELERLGPGDFHARTDWSVSWSYPCAQAETGCGTGPVAVAVRVITTLPDWAPPVDAQSELIQQWGIYIAALRAHEDGHKAIGLEAGNQILQHLQTLAAYPSCDDLEHAADEIGRRVTDEARRRETAYDRATRHGATQGARFP